MIHFIYNPKSGTGKTRRAVAKMARYCDRHRVGYEIHPTLYRNHCADLIAGLEARGERDVAVFGGDGTFHEALNGITRLDRTRLLLVPCGSGNDFVGANKYLKKPPIVLLKRMIAGKTKQIDFIELANGKRCLNVAGTGLDIEVLQKAMAMRRLTGRPRYLAALRRVLRNFHPYGITVTVNGETKRYSALMVGVCNGVRIGGGIRIAPRAKADDGKLNLVVIGNVPKKRVKWILPTFITGGHYGKPYSIEVLTDAAEIHCDTPHPIQLDGEIYKMPFCCHIVKSGLTLFV